MKVLKDFAGDNPDREQQQSGGCRLMDDSNNIKTNFLGKDGFRWWIGQVPPGS